MPIFDTGTLLQKLPFRVTQEELDAFEPSHGSPHLSAGQGCGNVICRQPGTKK